MGKIKLNCGNCKYHTEKDYGYSNYTVEGTIFDCLLQRNEGLPKDGWYHKEPVLQYANECDKFTEGSGVHFDVDGETTLDDYKDDVDIYQLLLFRDKL